MNVAQHALVGALRVYRATLSPLLTCLCGGLGLGCRFSPTCSQYALEAVQRYGVWKGMLLAARRLGRCHPWGGSEYDPVPGGGKAMPDGSAGRLALPEDGSRERSPHPGMHTCGIQAPGKGTGPTLSRTLG